MEYSFSAPGGSGVSTPQGSFGDLQKLRKSKTKDAAPPDDSVEAAQRAWWLDVSSPTWDDLRALGKLLHLHPLTLEDIFQREPREKLELFPKLGYYFVSFRAMESERSREQGRTKEDLSEDGDTYTHDPDIVSGVNMYLVVFREGICSFHFEDMSDHTERVRKKLQDLQATMVMSSDFVCHGILDSIVDGFFPVFHNIEKEVEALDELIISIGANTDKELERERNMGEVTDLLRVVQGGEAIEKAAKERGALDKPPPSPSSATEKASKDPEKTSATDAASALTASTTMMVRIRAAQAGVRGMWPFRARKAQRQTTVTLLRMTNTRRLVTALGRLLAAKGEVIAQLQKRLAHAPTELDWGGGDIAAYMGDVQDHIIFLQQSLAHYERILGHSHPAYLSHLRISFSQARGGVDKAIVGLTAVSMIVLCMQGFIGVFSMNVTVPHNTSPGPYWVFAGVVGGAALIASCVVAVVRLWWLQAKRRYSRRSLAGS
ncbi:hypothetical protein AURDEDRAFT_179314 [Auricularia subglabra TFB-10046 SS5]|nr:hypothetical protein AURDEDRAFT_179314 [Auricularia subglabra TFB-10046 SS5]